MEILAFGGSTFSLHIDETELTDRHISPAEITVSQARDIVRSAIGGRHGSLMLELFPGRHELLIFVRCNGDGPECFSFTTSEELIAAVLSLTGEASASSLYHYNNEYILAVWFLPPEESAPLMEFGVFVDLPPGFLSHMEEHGTLICPGQAISRIRRAFS